MALTPNTANQAVAAYVANASAVQFAAKVGGAAATPNALGRAVTGYTGHSRMFTNVRQQLRNAGYRANGTWPALTLAQWQGVYNVQPQLARTATAKQHAAGTAKVGKVLATAAKATGHAVPVSVLPPMASTRTQAGSTGTVPVRVKLAPAAKAGAASAKGQATQAAPVAPASTSGQQG